MAKDLNKADYYDIYKPLLTEKQCWIMEMYYFSDLSLSEISEETGITRQAAFNCIKKSEERLEELEKALSLFLPPLPPGIWKIQPLYLPPVIGFCPLY